MRKKIKDPVDKLLDSITRKEEQEKMFDSIENVKDLERFIRNVIPSRETKMFYLGRLAHAYDFATNVDEEGYPKMMLNQKLVDPWETVVYSMKKDPQLLK